MGQQRQGNKKIKVHHVPASEMRLDYLKLEEGSNWSINAFGTVPTFLTLSSSLFSFAAMLAQ